MSLIAPDSGLLIWMTIIFAIVFVILAKFGFPLITEMVEKRGERIEAGLAKAKEAESRLEHLAEEQAAILGQTRKEQDRILREAEDTRDKIIAQARDDARGQASKILQDARVQIEAERQEAVRDICGRVAEISLEVAEKVVRKDLGDESGQQALLDRYVEEASKVHLN